ncbi:DUF397 domain-containing protein [Nocardia sp. NPDC046763]|uniref:DUF397 domain-containing protein n=1 Tax=Nocardia sp. NPDC046763 TaxID=3155256 RepID=UPI0033C41AEE
MNIELSEADWFKSSYSHSGGECLEAAHLSHARVGVRDSKLGDSTPVLVFSPADWDVFNAAVQAGKFDLG